MRKLITQLIKAVPLLAFMLSFTLVNAQRTYETDAPTWDFAPEDLFNLTIRNVAQTSDRILEFDVFLLDMDAAQPMEVATTQGGLTYNTAILNAGTLAGTIIAGTSDFPSTQGFASINTATAGQVKLSTKSPPGSGAGFICSAAGNGSRIARIRLTCTQPFTTNSTANLFFAPSTGTNPYPSKIALYLASNGGLNTQIPTIMGDNCFVYENPVLNPGGTPPIAYNVTGTGSYCQGDAGIPVGLDGSQVGVNYTITPGGQVVAGTGAAIAFGNRTAGTYTVSGTADGSVPAISGTTAMTGNAVVTETPASTVEVTVSECDTYTWALNGVTYTASGNYTYVVGCVTNILHLTITPSSTVEVTESACDTYTWALNGSTYTVSGNYTYVAGCVTNILHLTITPSSTVEFTESVCDSYTWALNGVTYTVSGNYTYVVGCVTNILHLTVTPSGTTEYTESACDSYLWPINGVTYTVSGNYTFVSGCGTSILHLTITPSSTVEVTESACDTYTWALNGVTYTASGNYTFVVGCVTNILHLTITPTVTPTFAQLGPYFVGATPDALLGTSLNGIAGTWNPAVVSTAAAGTIVYTFTPTAGQCATTATMSILVNALPLATAATWNGSVNSDWFTVANWTMTPAVAVLGPATAITIPGSLTNYPTLLAPTSCASITINNGGSFIGAEFLTVGTATVKRDITNTKYHYLSSPVASATFGNVFANSLTTWAKKWNPITNGWQWQTSLNSFAPGAGYAVTTSTPTVTANFVGTLNAAPVTSILSNANGGWNLLGNPFQSAVDWDDVVKGAGVGAAVSVWTGTNYITWNGSVGGLTGGIIPAENGFMASTTIDAATLTVPLIARVHSAVPFFKESVSNVLELQAYGNNESDQTFVHFNNDATAAYDNQFDARKLFGEPYAPQLYSMITNDVLAINELPLIGNEVVDLGFSCNTNGEYSFTASGMESFDASTPIWLEDTKLNTTQDLRANAVYTFNYATGENVNRFKLHFKDANGINPTNGSGISVYSYDHNVMINNTTSLAGEVWVYDMTGREITHATMNGQMTTSIPMQVAIGTYMVKVVTAKSSVNQKVFIR